MNATAASLNRVLMAVKIAAWSVSPHTRKSRSRQLWYYFFSKSFLACERVNARDIWLHLKPLFSFSLNASCNESRMQFLLELIGTVMPSFPVKYLTGNYAKDGKWNKN